MRTLDGDINDGSSTLLGMKKHNVDRSLSPSLEGGSRTTIEVAFEKDQSRKGCRRLSKNIGDPQINLRSISFKSSEMNQNQEASTRNTPKTDQSPKTSKRSIGIDSKYMDFKSYPFKSNPKMPRKRCECPIF